MGFAHVVRVVRETESVKGEREGETSLSVKALKGDMASAERVAASVFLSFPADTHKCKLMSSAPLAEMFSESGEARDRAGV